VLGVLWWSWVGYSWLTSVVDPEEGAVRLTIFAAMAALLVAALCVPTVFGDTALLFASTYGGFAARRSSSSSSPAATTRACAIPLSASR
jgi:low temperature requirement protein LtrA